MKGYIAGMLTEGAEEVSEEILQDTILQGSKYLEESLESINGFKTKNTYDFFTHKKLKCTKIFKNSHFL